PSFEPLTSSALLGTHAPKIEALSGLPFEYPKGYAALKMFSASELQAGDADALGTALDGEPGVIVRSDKPLAGIEPSGVPHPESEFVRHLMASIRFGWAAAQHAHDKSTAWAYTSPYPWIADLPDGDIGEFAASLLPTLMEAMRQEDPDVFAMNLRAWQSAC